MNFQNRTLFIADNLDIMRGMDDETVDLIYLDPPFNTKKNFKAPIGSPAEGAEFKDIWTDEDIKFEWHGEIAEQNEELYQIIRASESVYDRSIRMSDVTVTSEPPIRTSAPIPTRQMQLPAAHTHKHTLFGQQEGKCNGCLLMFPFRNMTIDHIVAQSRGGTDHIENLQLLCNACNSTKSTRSQEEFVERLIEQGIRAAR